MSKVALQCAGWIAAISAVLTAPLFAYQVLAARGGPTFFSIVLQLINIALLLYVLTSLRSLLAQSKLAAANPYLTAIMIITVILYALSLIAAPEETFVLMLLFAGLVTLGILYIVAGIKLNKISGALPGLTLLSYAAMAVGTCLASVVLALFALPASMALDIALAIVFFRASEHVESVNALPSAKPES